MYDTDLFPLFFCLFRVLIVHLGIVFPCLHRIIVVFTHMFLFLTHESIHIILQLKIDLAVVAVPSTYEFIATSIQQLLLRIK
jgi:hypothetical protein